MLQGGCPGAHRNGLAVPYSLRRRGAAAAGWADFADAGRRHAPAMQLREQASCQGGKLQYLNVDPPERKADITVLNCKAQ